MEQYIDKLEQELKVRSSEYAFLERRLKIANSSEENSNVSKWGEDGEEWVNGQGQSHRKLDTGRSK